MVIYPTKLDPKATKLDPKPTKLDPRIAHSPLRQGHTFSFRTLRVLTAGATSKDSAPAWDIHPFT